MNYTVKAAAQATGILESRLRTWERRYGIPKPRRSASGRRLYDEEDLEEIRRMATLVDAGLSAADAADAVRTGQPVTVTTSAPARPSHPLIEVIVTAGEALDEGALANAVRQAVAELGWGPALDDVVFPALRRVGADWEAAAIPPAKEHFTSEVLRRELAAAVQALPLPPEGAPRLVLACPEGERHDLGLLSLLLLVRMAGVSALYLGADVPTSDLVELYESLRPEAVCLTATSETGLASLVRASRTLVAGRHARLFIGGPAVSASGAAAAGIRLPASLAAAAALMVENVRGS